MAGRPPVPHVAPELPSVVPELPSVVQRRVEEKGGSRPSSRAASPASDDDEGQNAPQSSRGVEEHRADPALRAALERLDAVRQSQPVMSDFAIENYLAASPSSVEVLADGGDAGPPRRCFSTDLLLAAVRAPPAAPPRRAHWDSSRSTSPGSTQRSWKTSASVASGSGASVSSVLPAAGRTDMHRGERSGRAAQRQASNGPATSRAPEESAVLRPREPQLPAGVPLPPRRPGRVPAPTLPMSARRGYGQEVGSLWAPPFHPLHSAR